MRKIKFSAAICEALKQSMLQDPKTILFGEGVDDPRAIFETTRGLPEVFGKERVFDMPLSENGMTGVAVGAALAGFRPIMTHQRIDFTLYAMDQIINHAAKRCYSSGGSQKVPLTIRAIVGRGWGQGSQHSQSLQALFAHIPGLKVVMPSTPYDVKGLLIESIRDDNPVIFIEYRRLFDELGEVPEDMYSIPIGKGILKSEGKDVTIVAHSYMVREALRAKEILDKMSIEVEIVDLRSIKPFDADLILSSVKKTGRLVVLDTGWKSFGITAEISAFVCENAFSYLKAPIRRIALPDVPTPTTQSLEKIYYPDFRQIVKDAVDLMGIEETELHEEIESILTAKPDKYVGPF